MAILQLPYNLSALFNFNEPDTNEGAMESSDEDFFDLFDFLPENTVTTNYLAKGEDRIQSLLRINYFPETNSGKRATAEKISRNI